MKGTAHAFVDGARPGIFIRTIWRSIDSDENVSEYKTEVVDVVAQEPDIGGSCDHRDLIYIEMTCPY